MCLATLIHGETHGGMKLSRIDYYLDATLEPTNILFKIANNRVSLVVEVPTVVALAIPSYHLLIGLSDFMIGTHFKVPQSRRV
jgi:hypothetical protein